MSFIKKIDRWPLISLLSLLGIFLLHLPFLSSDPNEKLCCSRDAWNSEGLTSIQIRNFVTQGYLSISESDNLLKMPLFNWLLYLPLKLFGSHLIVARFTVLIFFLISVFIAAHIAGWHRFIPFFSIIALMQFQVFQYSYLVMAEMAGIAMLLVAIAWLVKALQSVKHRAGFLFLASLFITLAYCMKIQFVYLVPLIPLSLLICRIIQSENVSTREVILSGAWATFFFAVYFLGWYLPHQSLYGYLLQFEFQNKLPTLEKIPGQIWINIRNGLLSPSTRFFILFAFITLITGIFYLVKSKDRAFIPVCIVIALLLLLESHRLMMTEFPPRYQVSLFFSISLMASMIISHLIKSRKASGFTKVFCKIMLVGFAVNNIADYFQMLSTRKYFISEINSYFKETISDPRQPVLGTWAPSATWESGVRAIPVWKDFLNYENPIENFKPQAIIVESNEITSIQYYSSQGIDLVAAADSSRQFQIGPWNLTVFWVMKPIK